VAGFLRVLSPADLHTAPESPLSVLWGWNKRPVMAAVPSGLSLTKLRISWYRVSILKFSAVHLKKRFLVGYGI
jgi:hypothetical protein